MFTPNELLPELKELADIEFNQLEPEDGPLADNVTFLMSRMLWLMRYSGAPMMEEYLVSQGYIS